LLSLKGKERAKDKLTKKKKEKRRNRPLFYLVSPLPEALLSQGQRVERFAA
jgi:hypothetical protein